MCNLEQILPKIGNTHNYGSYDAANYEASCKDDRIQTASFATSMAVRASAATTVTMASAKHFRP
jgi:hypothetical protein